MLPSENRTVTYKEQPGSSEPTAHLGQLNAPIYRGAYPEMNWSPSSAPDVRRCNARDIIVYKAYTEPIECVIPTFLKKEECLYLMQLADLNATRSKVGFNAIQGEISPSRTSSTCYIRRGSIELVDNISKAIAELVHVGTDHIEPLQIARYLPGERFTAHFDAFGAQNTTLPAGERVKTCLIYLNTISEGGYTAFPSAGFKVKPLSGAAIIWRNVNEYGGIDPSSLHAGEPSPTQAKYVLTAWIRQGAFQL